MNPTRVLAAPVALVVAAVLLSAGPLAAAERFTLAGPNVAVWNIAGETTIEAGSGADVVVLVERAGRDAADLRLESGAIRGRSATLRVVYPGNRVVYPALGRWSNSTTNRRSDGTFGDDMKDWIGGSRVTVAGGGSGLEAHANLRVQVPKGRKLAVFTLAGPATISNVDGDITFDGGSGSATAERVRGRLNLDLGSGRARVSDVDGELTVDTGSGSIEVSGVHGGRISLDTGSGSVEADDLRAGSLRIDTGSGGVTATGIESDDVSVDTGSGHVRLGFVSTASNVHVDTGSGGCTMLLPASFDASFTIETGSGGIRSTLPLVVERRDSDYLRGRMGEGRGEVHIETGSGGVLLTAAGGGAR